MRERVALALLAGLVSYGCGDDGATILCGPGTVEQDGECVVTGDACAAGTHFDPATSTCVPDATDPCGTGTHLDPQSGTCVADVACAPDEVAHQGVCLSQDEIDAAMADVVEGDPDDNDPKFGGTAETLTLPAVGDSTIFTGQIGTPVDLDDDGAVDQDWDVYSFEGSAGDAVKVLLKSLGAASMGYRVWGPNGYVRYSPLYFETQPQRHLFLPYTGTYYIGVAPQLRVDELDAQVGAAPEGGSEHSYVGTLERVAAFTAADLTLGTPASGNFRDLSNNLYLVKTSASDFVRARLLDPIAADVEPIFITLDASGAPTAEVANLDLIHVAAANDDLHVLVDYVRLIGPEDDYMLSAALLGDADLGTLSPDGSITSQPDPALAVPADSSGYLTVTVAAEQVVEIDVDMGSTSVSLPDVRVFGPDGSVVLTADDDDTDLRFYSSTGGKYIIEVFNDDIDGDAGSVTVDVVSTSVVDLGSFDGTTSTTASSTAAPLGTKTNAYYKISATEDIRAWIEVTQSSSVDLDGYVYTTSFTEIDSDTASGSTPPSLPFLAMASGDVWLVRVFNFSSTTAATDVVVAVNTALEPIADIEPNDTPATAQVLSGANMVLGEIDSDTDVDYFKFTPSATGLYKITATDLNDYTTLIVTLENGSGQLLEINDVGISPTVGAVLQGGVEYVVLVEDELGYTDYLLAFEEITTAGQLEAEPNDSSAATPVALSAVPATVVGSLTASTDEDWYKVTLTTATVVGLPLVATDLGGNVQPPHGGMQVQLFGSDGTTEIPGTAGAYSMPAGDSFIRVSGYGTAGGNTYTLDIILDPPLTYTNNPNLPIDGSNTTQVDTIAVASTCVIDSISVDVNITHTYRGDLVVTLESPSGTTRVLHDATGGSDDNVIGNYPNTLTPEDDLSLLAGEQAQGNWTLTVEDTYPSSDHGTWNSWSLNIVCQ